MLTPDFKEFIQSLNDNDVRYLVVGGYAVALHGHPRYTKDIDIWVDLNRENAEKLIQAIQQFGFESLGLKADDFLDLENLRKNKRSSGRLQDLADLENLE
jgi:phage replication-related protein YjqB (UPF0714/DUF867 family)